MAATFRERFEIPKRYTTWAYGLMAIGLISIIILYITHGSKTGSDEESLHENARFWASLLLNSIYFLLVTNAAMFFICATTLAWGGWQISFRRVSEAISTCVPIIGIISFVILMVLVWGPNHTLYHGLIRITYRTIQSWLINQDSWTRISLLFGPSLP